MIAMSLADIAQVVSGVVKDADGEATVTGSWFTDSRQVVPGGLFAAMIGQYADGHKFAAAAVAEGAAAVLASRPVGVPAVVVDDVVAALGRLAAHLIARCTHLMVIGITGSHGKTTTKDLVVHVLGRQYETVATTGNLSNEIGVALTVSKITARTRVLVLEMGARGVGHIDYLTKIARPTIGAVLNVGSAHIGEFGGVEQVAVAKEEMVEALRADGAAVLNADEPRVLAMAGRTWASVTTFGRTEAAGVRATDITLNSSGQAAFTLAVGGQRFPVSLQYVGEHQVMNALAAAAIAAWAGIAVAAIAVGLSSARPVLPWPMQVTEYGETLTLINDACNASTQSVRAGLATLRAVAGHRRTIAVLGPMLELEADELSEHSKIGTAAAEAGVSHVLAVGGATAHSTAHAAMLAGAWATCRSDLDTALGVLERLLIPGDVVLVKGSRAAGLEQLAEALHERYGSQIAAPTGNE